MLPFRGVVRYRKEWLCATVSRLPWMRREGAGGAGSLVGSDQEVRRQMARFRAVAKATRRGAPDELAGSRKTYRESAGRKRINTQSKRSSSESSVHETS